MDYDQLTKKVGTNVPVGQYFDALGRAIALAEVYAEVMAEAKAEAKAQYDKEKKASVEMMLRTKKHQYSTDEIAAIFGLAVEEVRELEAKVAGDSVEA
ncbi:MAG: hypothetical protein LBO05_00550 [Deltaproteobacteria bacterium]|nr:hypothetical protein [Deltaproteobacteria bacterium]